MPKFSFAIQRPITGSVGGHYSGPFKIVHHTTEGNSAKDALKTYKKRRNDPHFTVDGEDIFQHVDTDESARSLRNKPPGYPETNHNSAVQIEVVGFARLPKGLPTLRNVARLLRWIEMTHDVPRVWPNGYPKIATPKGHNPGGHNRDPKTWDEQSGHFGHCHVPKNTHWDPGYTKSEVEFLMQAEFSDTGDFLNEDDLSDIIADLSSVPSSLEQA